MSKTLVIAEKPSVAQDIVKGLKAGYAYKQKLHAQHPDASAVRAEVYRGRDRGR